MMMPFTMILTICISIGAETIVHGWARAYPLFVSGGHGEGNTGGQESTSSTESSCCDLA